MEEDIIKNIKNTLNSANTIYNNGDHTSATILYFKSFFMISDLIILKKEGKTPKDHSERFRILEKKFPELYLILDKYFPVYRDTYSLSIPKGTCKEIKENVEKIIEKYQIKV